MSKRARRNSVSTAQAAAYSYCETVTAGPMAPWHIRARTADQPLRPGGGIRGEALCGRNLNGGWDIPGREVTAADAIVLGFDVCSGCSETYAKETT